MNTQGIVQAPDSVLESVAYPVKKFDTGLRMLAALLAKAASEPGRAGVAAPQIGVAKQVFAANLSTSDEPQVFVNPVIVEKSGPLESEAEGRLSIADHWYSVARFHNVTMLAQRPDGEEVWVDATGMDARILQHECDHLMGRLVCDIGMLRV